MKLMRIWNIRVHFKAVLISGLLTKLRINFRDVYYHYFTSSLWHTPDFLDTAK